MRRMDAEERRARLAGRHRLTPTVRAGDVVDAVRSVVVLHSSDPATVFLSARARTTGFEPARLERALYEERTLVRMLAMRRAVEGHGCPPAIALHSIDERRAALIYRRPLDRPQLRAVPRRRADLRGRDLPAHAEPDLETAGARTR